MSRALAAAVALGSVAVLIEGGVNYSAEVRGAGSLACVAASTATAGGAWPRAQLLSSPGDSRYDRAVRF